MKSSREQPKYVICSNCGMEQWVGYKTCQRCGANIQTRASESQKPSETKWDKAIAIASLVLVLIPLPCAMFAVAPDIGGAKEFFYQQFLGHSSYISLPGEFEKILGGEFLGAVLSVCAIFFGKRTLRRFRGRSDDQLFEWLATIAVVLGGLEFLATILPLILIAIFLIIVKLFGMPSFG